VKKVVLILVAVVLVAGAAYSALVLKQPAANSPSDIKVPMTAERIERGKYIFETLADCAGCHSERNWEKFSAPVYEGRAGVGQAFPKEMGLPGSVVAPNLTPDAETGLGNWTDGEKLRAIREGVSKDGRALFPFMPYTKYRDMSDEDAQSVVAYLNSLPPVKNRVARTQLDFPVKYLIKFAPAPVTQPVPPPDRNNKVKYGEYLVKVGGCIDCHSQLDKGEPVKGKEYAGGFEFVFPTNSVRSANITPDEESGIGKWSEDRFVAKFKGFANMTYENAPRMTQANFTLMPWLAVSQLPEQDLRAIYAYLRTVKPVHNPVEVHPPPAPPQS
jgi:mono/diheme cytochrome c family protein